jgi:hypothetical protein
MTLLNSQNAVDFQARSETLKTSIDRFAQRRQRIAEYASQALLEADPRDAVIDSTEADMMLVQSFVSEALDSELTQTIPSVESLERVLPVIAVQSQLTKLTLSIAKLKERRLDRQARAGAIDEQPGQPLAVLDQRSVDEAIVEAPSRPEPMEPWPSVDQPQEQ